MDNPGIIFAIFMLLVGLLATAGYGLMSVAQYKGARAAFYATAFFLFAIGVELGLVMAWPLYAKIFVAGCFGFVAAGALVYALHSVSLFEKSQATKEAPKETLAALESPKTLDNTISFACAWSKPPSHYREDKTLHIVDFQGVPVSGVDFNRQSAGPMHFIRSSDSFTPSEHYSNMWYRCDVTNHSSQPVRNLWTKFPVVYNAVVSTENGTRSGAMIAAGYARSPMLDLAAGETDYFYFANASAVFVSVLPPSTALLQTRANDTHQRSPRNCFIQLGCKLHAIAKTVKCQYRLGTPITANFLDLLEVASASGPQTPDLAPIKLLRIGQAAA